ncbi:hypothetical protein [Kitasatospora sp. NPDC057936]|uniref:hypothetical protein n=1 Tax=Kitasatospora sp. NPDC057936 TaxID=3346283 RepID=UPI0036D7C43C
MIKDDATDAAVSYGRRVENEVFPPYPVRDVRARYVWQAGCPSDFADVTVDFEPWENGIVLEVAHGAELVGTIPEGELRSWHEAFVEGIREELAARGAGEVALAVVIHRTVIHDVDSSARSFRAAGRVAVREAFVRIDGPGPALAAPSRPHRRQSSIPVKT